MDACDRFIEMLRKELPPLVTTADLIRIGLFSSASVAQAARKAGNFPECFRITKRRLVYPLEGVIEWLQTKR